MICLESAVMNGFNATGNWYKQPTTNVIHGWPRYKRHVGNGAVTIANTVKPCSREKNMSLDQS